MKRIRGLIRLVIFLSSWKQRKINKTLWVHLIHSWKIIENTTSFYEKLETEMSDIFYYFLGFPWNKILWVVGKKKKSMENKKNIENNSKKTPIFYSSFSWKLVVYSIVFQPIIKRTLHLH